MKLYVVTGQLPVEAVPRNQEYIFRPDFSYAWQECVRKGEGFERVIWTGWPKCFLEENARSAVIGQLDALDCVPVFLSKEVYELGYRDYGAKTLWPLCLYEELKWETGYGARWNAYEQLNQLYADTLAVEVSSDDWVWVQDPRLMLLPSMLRERVPKLHIAYFHHLPFPSYELFRELPERDKLLQGVLGADYVGFQTHNYMRHFISTVERVCHLNFNFDEVNSRGHLVRVDALSVGVDYDKFHHCVENEGVQQEIERCRLFTGNHRLLLSVDSLSYSRGIRRRLRAYEEFLVHYPQEREKVVLAQIFYPSPEEDTHLKEEVDRWTEELNNRFGTERWRPVCNYYHRFTFEELAAFLFVADVFLATPLRCGMDLVAKEYAACKQENGGVLILSEFAGASVELPDALLVNPYDTESMMSAIRKAMDMSLDEQRLRLGRMQVHLAKFDAKGWFHAFKDEWEDAYTKSRYYKEKEITPSLTRQISTSYAQSHNRLIMLDYEGTLVDYPSPDYDGTPGSEVRDILRRYCEEKDNHVLLTSDLRAVDLERWFGDLPMSIVAEQGACFKGEYGGWQRSQPAQPWSEGLLSVLKMFVEKTPHAYLERQDTVLIWHYEQTDTWLGDLRAGQLIRTLYLICQQQRLQIMQGNRALEIKPVGFTNGAEVKQMVYGNDYDFILSLSNEKTDDELFCSLPEDAVTVKVGETSEYARFNIPIRRDTISFLEEVLEQSKRTFHVGRFSKMFHALRGK